MNQSYISVTTSTVRISDKLEQEAQGSKSKEFMTISYKAPSMERSHSRRQHFYYKNKGCDTLPCPKNNYVPPTQGHICLSASTPLTLTLVPNCHMLDQKLIFELVFVKLA